MFNLKRQILRISFVFALVMIINIPKSASQEWNSARIRVLYGSNIPFNFNSLDKIKNGIEIIGGTQIGISMADSSRVGHTLQGFILNFRSFNSQINLKGDVYSLPLNRIRVKAENAIGLGSGFSSGYKDCCCRYRHCTRRSCHQKIAKASAIHPSFRQPRSRMPGHK